MINATTIYKNNDQVSFTRAFDNCLWYVTDCGFEFPVPYSETQGATFKAKDKARLFFRYIKKHAAVVQPT